MNVKQVEINNENTTSPNHSPFRGVVNTFFCVSYEKCMFLNDHQFAICMILNHHSVFHLTVLTGKYRLRTLLTSTTTTSATTLMLNLQARNSLITMTGIFIR